MDLDEKAATSRGVVRIADAKMQTYRLKDTELTEAASIGKSDGFPKYGDFLAVTAVDANGADLGPRWVECPTDLARTLVDAGVDEDDLFVVTKAVKTDDEAWSVEVETDG